MKRQPAVAGRFYPENRDELLKSIGESYAHFLGVQKNEIHASGKLRMLIAPHAGYMFSGPPSSWGFSRLKQERPLPSRIVLLGPKHTPYGAGVSVSSSDFWTTPLGDVPVDKEFVKRLCSVSEVFTADTDAHRYEHSIEVQLPFLQELYGKKEFKIVPIAIQFNVFSIFQTLSYELHDAITESEGETLIIVSSDFSHDTPLDEAYKLDGEAIELIKRLDAKGFYDLVVSENRSICGLMPITLGLTLMKAMNVQAQLLKYSTSMEIMDHDRGVGYASIIFEDKK